MISNKTLINAYSKDKKIFEEGAKILKKEAQNNGYKITISGLTVFLNNCAGSETLDDDVYNFYQLCIPYAIK